jgi:hypothetical protein
MNWHIIAHNSFGGKSCIHFQVLDVVMPSLQEAGSPSTAILKNEACQPSTFLKPYVSEIFLGASLHFENIFVILRHLGKQFISFTDQPFTQNLSP